MLDNIKAIQKTNQKTAEMLNQLMGLFQFTSVNEAFVLLRASMKALRDRIPVQEAIHLGAQLPALLRGFYYEGWDVDAEPNRSRTKDQFLEVVRFHLGGHHEINLDQAVPGALKVILDAIDQGEAVQVLHMLPKEIQAICPE